jgi:MFS family permease
MLSYREGSIPWMFALIGLSSAFLVMGRPARSSLLPLVVPNNAFANAVTWNVNLFQIASMTGPAVGGYVVALSLARVKDVSWAYMLDAVCCAIFGFLIFAVHARPQTKEGDTDRSLLAGIRFVWRTKILLATMLLDLFAVLLGGVVWLLPVFASDILKVGPSGLGWLRAADAVGAITMGIIIAHLPPMKHAGRNMLVAVIGFGAATIVFGYSTNYALSLAMMFAIGALDNISVVVRHTLVQVLTPDAMRGRVSAVNNVSIGCSNELGGFRAGAVAQVIGPVASVVAGGIGTIVVVVLVALKWPQVRKYGSLTDGRHS